MPPFAPRSRAQLYEEIAGRGSRQAKVKVPWRSTARGRRCAQSWGRSPMESFQRWGPARDPGCPRDSRRQAMSGCDVDRLEALIEGTLDGARAAEARAHLEGCARCAEEIRWLRKSAAVFSRARAGKSPLRASPPFAAVLAEVRGRRERWHGPRISKVSASARVPPRAPPGWASPRRRRSPSSPPPAAIATRPRSRPSPRRASPATTIPARSSPRRRPMPPIAPSPAPRTSTARASWPRRARTSPARAPSIPT